MHEEIRLSTFLIYHFPTTLELQFFSFFRFFACSLTFIILIYIFYIFIILCTFIFSLIFFYEKYFIRMLYMIFLIPLEQILNGKFTNYTRSQKIT